MSVLPHRSTRGITHQLLVPLAGASIFVVAVIGLLLTIGARDAARDGLAAQADAIHDFAAPLAAPAHGKPAHGWAGNVNRVAVAHHAHVTIVIGGRSRGLGASRVAS